MDMKSVFATYIVGAFVESPEPVRRLSIDRNIGDRPGVISGPVPKWAQDAIEKAVNREMATWK